LLEIVFHHGAMTAKPLFEIMRALIAERVSASIKAQKDDSDPEASLRLKGSDEKDVPLSDQDQTTILGVLSFISGRYMDLATKRNNLLHATWYIGYSSVDDPDSSTFLVSKFTPNGEGLRKLELPSKASELKDLAEICRTIEGWILWLQSCLTGSVKVAKTFQYDKETKIWWLVTPQGFRTTLPKI
jgi:hypothetical protein